MTPADIRVQLKLGLLFTVGVIVLIAISIYQIRHDHRLDCKTTLPLLIVAIFMIGVLGMLVRL